MSASAPRATGLKNPAVKHIKFKGSRLQGFFCYYDKEILEPNLRNVKVDLSKGFYILDKDLFSITGFVESTKSNIISNEVRDITDMLIVKSWKDKKGEVVLKGTYAELKNTVKDSKIYTYTRSAYIMFEGELCRLELTGAGFATWIKEVESNAAHADSIVRHTGNVEKVQGTVEYNEPHWEVGEKADPATWNKILELDSKILQPYLNEYLGKAKSGQDTHHETQEETFDCKDWRNYKMPSGSRMCELTAYQIREALDACVEAGDVNCPVYDCLSQATVEYNQAIKTWESKKDAKGKLLKDYTIEEIESLLARIPKDHPVKFFLEAAHEAMMEAGQAGEEDIPF